MKLMIDQELLHAKEGAQEIEKPQEKPESKAGKIARSILGVVLAAGIIAFMVYLFLNR